MRFHPAPSRSTASPEFSAAPSFVVAGLSPNLVTYSAGLALQQEAAARLEAGVDTGTVLALEHEPVFTAGRRAERNEYPSDGTPVVPVNRGGRVTWHGPGQLVVYPVIRLTHGFGGADLVHALERALIATAAEFGVSGNLIEGRTGVWALPAAPGPLVPAKFAQIGIHVGRRIVSHGLALNCNNDLSPFDTFTPCGITDAGVASLTQLAGRTITPADALPALQVHLAPVLERFAA
ncbi:lipoyl(octanoyl) transferase [Leucobacter komagatae]|uniref:Octanoyltransferase n=1 Tax=Leucobacter komagatae TaxID=55969 RepID=A0A542Y4X1_9MICO|nr:lipoyl(octanoyl) transferase LipB [Leucobacter komagatae]TQL43134.1 lipoyl(octanoyl) transferase [Leucobacter komagatae]